jgi:hypothetical protein
VLAVVKYVWILRLVDLFALLLASTLFALSFLRTAPTLVGARFQRSDHLVVGAAIVAGALMPSVFAPQTPGYNQITLWILLCVSSLLLLLADDRVTGSVEPVAWAVVGVLTWTQIVVKWPAVIAMLPLLALALWRKKPRSWSAPRCIAAIAVGVVLAAVLTQLLVAPLPELLRGLKSGSHDLSTYGGHSTQGLLSQYVLDLWHLGSTIMRTYWYLLLAAAAVVLCAATRYAHGAALALGVGLCLLTPALILSGVARGGAGPNVTLESKSAVLPAYVAFALVAGATAICVRRRVPIDRRLLFLGSLLAMPLLSAAGTNNPIWFNALFTATFWVAAGLAIMSVALPKSGHYLVRGLAISFATLIAFTAVDGTWSNPYRQPRLSADTVAVTISGPLSGLQVDPSTARFLQDARSTVRNYIGSDPPTMVAWAGVPGAVVAAGLVQPMFAWVNQGTRPALWVLESSCQQGGHGVLLLELAGGPNPASDAASMPSQCSGRNWIKRPDISVPLLLAVQLGVTHLELYYAAPVTGPNAYPISLKDQR